MCGLHVLNIKYINVIYYSWIIYNNKVYLQWHESLLCRYTGSTSDDKPQTSCKHFSGKDISTVPGGAEQGIAFGSTTATTFCLLAALEMSICIIRW